MATQMSKSEAREVIWISDSERNTFEGAPAAQMLSGIVAVSKGPAVRLNSWRLHNTISVPLDRSEVLSLYHALGDWLMDANKDEK